MSDLRDDLAIAEGIGLAHDAGNLLGALRLYCDLLALPGVLREEHRHYADQLRLLSQRSGTLVDRLLNPRSTTGLPENGNAFESPGTVSVPDVIEQCRGLLSTIAQRPVAIRYGLGAETPVTASRETVERILVNLTKNAAEASVPGGAIALRVGSVRETPSSRSRLVLSIQDHGRGMSAAEVKVLMERTTSTGERRPASAARDPHFQLREAPAWPLDALTPVAGNRPGRGLGFRVVRELVQASGGELRLKSRSGRGTTVEIAWAMAGELSGPPMRWRMGDGVCERRGVPPGNATGVSKAIKGRVSC